jgi:hypothetical protein
MAIILNDETTVVFLTNLILTDDVVTLPSYHNDGADSASLSESNSIAITTYLFSTDTSSLDQEVPYYNAVGNIFDSATILESISNALDNSDSLTLFEISTLTVSFSSDDSATFDEAITFFWDVYDSASLSEQVFIENNSVDSATLNESNQIELSDADSGSLSEFANNIDLSNSDSAALAEAVSLIVDTNDTSTLFEFIDKIDLYSVIDTSALSDLASINISANSADSLTSFEDFHFDAETPQEDFLTVDDLPFISVNIATSDDPILTEGISNIALFVYEGIILSEATSIALNAIDNTIFTDNRSIVVDASSSDTTYSVADSSNIDANIASSDNSSIDEQNSISANVNVSDNANQTEILQIFLFSNDSANLNEGTGSISQNSNDFANTLDQNLGLSVSANVDSAMFSENDKFIEISSKDIESVFNENSLSIDLSSQDSEIFEELAVIGVFNSDSATLIEKLINALDAQDSGTALESFQNTANLQGQDLYIFADLGNVSVAKFAIDSIFAVESAPSVGLNVIQLITFKEGRTGIGKAGVINLLINTNPTIHGTVHGPVIQYDSGTTTHGTATGPDITISIIGGTVPILL